VLDEQVALTWKKRRALGLRFAYGTLAVKHLDVIPREPKILQRSFWVNLRASINAERLLRACFPNWIATLSHTRQSARSTNRQVPFPPAKDLPVRPDGTVRCETFTFFLGVDDMRERTAHFP